jgi:hypothetical protein
MIEQFWIAVCEAGRIAGLAIAAGALALMLWETIQAARRP